MRMVFGLVLILGIGLAGFAVYMARGYVSEYQAELQAERAARAQIVPTKEVYVATRPVRYGERLKPEDVRAVPWPETALPEGAFLVADGTLFPKDEKELRTVTRAMEKDEPILAVKVTEPGEDAGVSSRLSKGMRAFAIQVDVQTGVSGFLRPGDRVDIYWTGNVVMNGPDGPVRGDITKLIEAGVSLIAVDQSADGDRNNPSIARTVTVELTPQQVASLAQAQSSGRLSLSLVGASDNTVAEAANVDQRTLLGIEERKVVQAEEQKVCTIKTRKGGELIEVPVECTN
ncbi:Flp pilus assembly protein CpaB [Frigidibacter sp. ROC022]|uniref:Flp pilus assembly protein CpaB n=1 Tax=Frigidibacter sp. ROC022 TaxID=2971796 RepID=UPI00215A940D|nr:Flp pilus assembly protein CpaB [Frigidibacter sp. ROC022]MCR8723654.1 Flp pilus assembly protein CpaB [Frigidibacter sp. ROC022]